MIATPIKMPSLPTLHSLVGPLHPSSTLCFWAQKAMLLIWVLLLSAGTLSSSSYGQFSNSDFSMDDDDDLVIGGDIFSDFSEELEASQVFEDERFYRYGRFYSFSLSAGMTSFTGNRGLAYNNLPPGVGFSLLYFLNFHVGFGLGFMLTEHYMDIQGKTEGFSDRPPGLIEVNMFRTYINFRYYLDTFDLGTAFTYANPFFTGRMEFWYQTNKFVESPSIPNDSNGSVGMAYGFGFEFPLQIKEYYLGVECLFHKVNLKDKYTQLYRPLPENPEAGYEDLSGGTLFDAWSVFMSYVVSW